MKNVVMGLFDRLEDAESVIAQLTSSPLDLESIQVIHADTAIQRRLGLQAGLPARRAVRTGAVLGALVAAAIGFAGAVPLPPDSTSPGPFASLGPLLAMSFGAVLGLVLGAIAGAISDRLRIPGGHAAEVAEAIDAGATAVTVRTENLPTAKAIGDLFQRSGSKVLSSGPAEVDGRNVAELAFAPASESAGASDPAANPDALPEAHEAFAPPWRKEEPSEAGPTWLDADTAPSVTANDPGALDRTPSSPPDDTPQHTGLPSLDGDLLFPSATPPTSTTASDPLPRTIRRGETVSTPDRTTREVQPREPVASTGEAASLEFESPSLDDLPLSPRVLRSLKKAGIEDMVALRMLAAQGEAGIRALPGIGPAAYKELKQGLETQGIDVSSANTSVEVTTSSATRSPQTTSSKPMRSEAEHAVRKKRAAPRSKPEPQSQVDEAAESVLREIFGSASNRDA